MAKPRSSSAERRERILQVAARNFAEYGYAATSLRQIAKDVGCSLTLLDHHFGDKAHLLQAVIKQQDELCQARLVGLKAVLSGPSEFVLDDFIATWASYEFDLHELPEGRRYLRLMLRLQADREVNEQVRKELNCSQATVIEGFKRAWPELTRQDLNRVWRMASSALYAAVVETDEGNEADHSHDVQAARDRAIAFLLDGLKSYCTDPGARKSNKAASAAEPE